MHIDSADLYALKIPFVMPPMSHSAHKNRGACDSVVLQLKSAGVVGNGEAVFREYVSGAHGDATDPLERAAGMARRLIAMLPDRDASWRDAAGLARHGDPSDLPMVCALETALLELDCRLSGRDAYDVLGLEPVRHTVTFSGVIALFPPRVAAHTLEQFKLLGASSFKIKLGPDPGANREILAACRAAAGTNADLRVDANGAWRSLDAEAHLDACVAAGITAIEQPFHVGDQGADEALRRAVKRGFLFIADEGFLSERDLDGISRAGTYRMLNFRLAKNGGLGRVLEFARIAAERGIGYQLGCMAGETAILSALGRLAGSLLPSPRWFEGGYDRLLYVDHLVDNPFRYASDGTAPIVRGEGIGCTVRQDRLEALSVGRVRLF